MIIKNKDFINLIKKLDKYFKINEYIYLEHIQLKHEKRTYAEDSENINKKDIFIPKKNENIYYNFRIDEKLEKIDKYQFFYYLNGKVSIYLFNDLEMEIKNKEVLNAYKSLLNLRAIKLEDF